MGCPAVPGRVYADRWIRAVDAGREWGGGGRAGMVEGRARPRTDKEGGVLRFFLCTEQNTKGEEKKKEDRVGLADVEI
jgi:hypothetical protein